MPPQVEPIDGPELDRLITALLNATGTVHQLIDDEQRDGYTDGLEIIPTGDVFDGEQEVRRYFAETRTAFPDQRNSNVEMHHADDSVVVEFDLDGTHLGPFRGLPPTGRAFTCRTLAIFVFAEGSDRIVCERVYFDTATILRQLGIAHDPLKLTGRVATVLNHPLTIGRAVFRQATGR